MKLLVLFFLTSFVFLLNNILVNNFFPKVLCLRLVKGILNDFDALRLALKMGSKFLQANADTFSLTSEICQGPRFFFPDSSS